MSQHLGGNGAGGSWKAQGVESVETTSFDSESTGVRARVRFKARGVYLNI